MVVAERMLGTSLRYYVLEMGSPQKGNSVTVMYRHFSFFRALDSSLHLTYQQLGTDLSLS